MARNVIDCLLIQAAEYEQRFLAVLRDEALAAVMAKPYLEQHSGKDDRNARCKVCKRRQVELRLADADRKSAKNAVWALR